MIIDIVLGYAQGRGGLETVLSSISNELVSRGHRVRIFQNRPPKYSDWIFSLPEIYYYDPAETGYVEKYQGEIDFWRQSIGYRRLLDQLGIPDVILATHGTSFSALCNLAISHLGKDRPPILSWLHAPPEVFGSENLLRYSDSHLVITNAMGNKINSYSNAPIHYIGNPIDLSSTERVRRTTDQTRFLYIGRLTNRDKRLDVLFLALNLLKGNWSIDIIGDGPARRNLEQFAQQLGISEKVNWLGWQNDPWSVVDESSLLLLTSDYEGFGLVLVEALARGIPVIATNCDGPIDIVKDGVNGWLFQTGDYTALAKKLQLIIDQEMPLPASNICEESIQTFYLHAVVDRLESAITKTWEGHIVSK